MIDLDSIELIQEYLIETKKADFLRDTEKQDSVIRRIEIIGEATKNIPISFKKKYPKIPWQDISDMRNKIVHEYFGIDLGITWEVARKDIKDLKKEIEKILNSSEVV